MAYIKLKIIGVIAVGFLVLPRICFSEEGSHQLLRPDLRKAWFKPNLVLDTDPVCSSFLSSVRAKFASADPEYLNLIGFKRIPGPFEASDDDDPRIQVDADDPHQIVLKVSKETKLYAYFVNLGGCGGACEQEQLFISKESFPNDGPDKRTAASTPAAPNWTLTKNRSGAFFAQGNVDGHLQLYRIVSPRDWRLSCDVALKPDQAQESAYPEVQGARKAVVALVNRTEGLSRVAGDCGSSRTSGRWRKQVEDGLHETLYRPWVLAVSKIRHYSENSYGDYERIEDGLKLWSLGGIEQHRDFANYQAQLAETIAVLAKFYSKQYGWPTKRSVEIARSAITNAISYGFGFYMYSPFPSEGERQLRTAILERKPIAEIRAITLENGIADRSGREGGDSILNIAISYPEALRYLLEIDPSPNLPNEFGKTPLMYAVQQNQLEAAKILLAAGADPNAATIIPSDRCNYTLETAHMTALHYAARYASATMIKLLVKNGAVTFFQSYKPLQQHEYPIDWLHRYTAAATKGEENRNIAPGEIDEARNLLHVPDEFERNRIAKSMALRAESDYAKGKMESAYRHLQIAIAAQPNNQKAISDLPLIALKAGQFGPAIKAANQATEVLKEPGLQAAAWFNKGLVCEQQTVRSLLDYDGSRCGNDWIRPFVRAWQMEATPARTNKLRNLFNPEEAGVCVVSATKPTSHKVRFLNVSEISTKGLYENLVRIYILHRADEEIAPTTIQWSVKFMGQTTPTVLIPKVAEKLVLDQDAITVFEGTNYGIPTINGHVCSAK